MRNGCPYVLGCLKLLKVITVHTVHTVPTVPTVHTVLCRTLTGLIDVDSELIWSFVNVGDVDYAVDDVITD